MRWTRALLLGVLLALIWSGSASASTSSSDVEATLDGRPIDLSEIGRYQCHDLDFPVIRCFRKAIDRDLSIEADDDVLGISASLSMATQVVYVTLYDGANFSSSSISLSQDYDALATIGWNDRVSSFRARNGETGRFYVDWFRSGSSWSFCCNQGTASLSSWDNSFSSVYRT